jgi:2-dehydro-3-deoxy-D-arabinonate dehydratase
MRYYSLPGADGPRLVARDGDTAHDLTASRSALSGFGALARAAAIAGEDVDTLARRHVGTEVPLERLEAARRPLDPAEVWAAGVTYEISEQAREAESGMPEIYARVYDAERPEVFFKATPSRTVGPGEAVGVRADSDWNVPEPELAVVLYEGEPVGYTVGNDVSSRAIEGENPLYLPQAKTYDRSCAIGPCVASPGTVGDPHDLIIAMTIERDGDTVFEGTTSTAEMVRSCEELADYYTRHNHVPELSVLLTGTSLVPEEGFTLREGDTVNIDIDRIGELTNGVVTV